MYPKEKWLNMDGAFWIKPSKKEIGPRQTKPKLYAKMARFHMLAQKACGVEISNLGFSLWTLTKSGSKSKTEIEPLRKEPQKLANGIVFFFFFFLLILFVFFNCPSFLQQLSVIESHFSITLLRWFLFIFRVFNVRLNNSIKLDFQYCYIAIVIMNLKLLAF